MFLKRLEINGFKSFANKTSLEFYFSGEEKRGITAIVGPNGSGKSNIADSIRWVMGEQSMKNLRGKKSEDIIFAGSGKKARLGSASASLFFDNSARRIPLDFSEVSITRKIYRSGESEFLINGSKVRLQDIVDLLAKAGIGRESYSIVTQGMADAVLNATPLERRLLIEEAAGVKQYQIKKERSVKKLETTRENLKRAKELSEEIKPHLKMLKRQAEKAAQGEEISQKLKEKQTAYFFCLWNGYKKEREELISKKEELGIKMMNIQREVDKLSDELKKEAQEGRENLRILELERQRNDASSRLNDLEKDLVVTEGRIQIEKERAKSLAIIESIKTESISVDFTYVKKELETIQAEQEKLLERISGAKSLEELKEIQDLAFSIRNKVGGLKEDIEKGKKDLEKKPERVMKGELEPEKENVVVLELEERTKRLRREIEEQKVQISKIEKEIVEEKQKDNDRRRQFFEIEGSLRKKQFELDKSKDDFNDSKVALARVEVREEDLKNDVRGALNLDPEDIKWQGDLAIVDQFALSNEINKLKIQMEQIGGIDPVVVEEYRETNERYEFLTREAEDLEKAILSLKEVIKEMDKKINDSFETTFIEIGKEFTKYFRIIFGGGNASLNKVKVEVRKSRSVEEEADETSEEAGAEAKEEKKNFETGIDIVACPPGKRISNLSMLSGGERSLTSLALLFSIISHNPPPFSVLDEVEAALDEANSKRFGRIIQELSNQTQFVIITHNRETMRQASLLYGVTMGEDGISKLLSVRLDQVGQGGRIKAGG